MKFIMCLIIAGAVLTTNSGLAKDRSSRNDNKNTLKSLKKEMKNERGASEVLKLFTSNGILVVYRPFNMLADYIYQRLPTEGKARRNFVARLESILDYYTYASIGYSVTEVKYDFIEFQTALLLRDTARGLGIPLSDSYKAMLKMALERKD